MQQQSSIMLMRRNGGLAFLITVLIGYAQWLSYRIHTLGSLRALTLLSLGVVYLVIGIASIYSDNPKTKTALWGYYIIQIILGMSIVYLGEGTTWLVIFPLVSQIVVSLPRRNAWLLNIVIFTNLLIMLVILEKGNFNWQLAFGLTCGMVFVILFSQIVLNEQNSRSDAERLYAELSVANHKLHEYAVQVEELATIQERNRLARDIHDGLGHYLTAINMQIKAAQAVLDLDPMRTLDALTKAQVLAEEALGDVRQSVAALRGGSTFSQPLPEAIETLVSECRAEGLVVELTNRGDYRVLVQQADLTLYRVVQEALTNVRKHALASRVDVTLQYEVNRVILTVSDNGIGVENPDGGFGLFGLRERVHLLHGRVDIRTAPRQGFCIEVELPG